MAVLAARDIALQVPVHSVAPKDRSWCDRHASPARALSPPGPGNSVNIAGSQQTYNKIISASRWHHLKGVEIPHNADSSHTVLIAVVDGWQANIRHLEESGQLCLLDIASCVFSEAGNIMTGEKVCHYKLEVGRKMEDRWGRLRIGSQQKPFLIRLVGSFTI